MWYGEKPMLNPFLTSRGDWPSWPPRRGMRVVFVASRTLTGIWVYSLFAEEKILLATSRAGTGEMMLTLVQDGFQIGHLVDLGSC